MKNTKRKVNENMKMKVGVVCQCEPEFDVRMGLVKAANVSCTHFFFDKKHFTSYHMNYKCANVEE